MLQLNKNYKRGSAALTTVLVVTSILVILGTTVVVTGINTSRVSENYKSNVLVRKRAESCIEETLLKVRENTQFVGQIDLSYTDGTCNTVVADDPETEDLKVVTVQGVLDEFTFRDIKYVDTTSEPFTIINSPETECTVTDCGEHTDNGDGTCTAFLDDPVEDGYIQKQFNNNNQKVKYKIFNSGNSIKVGNSVNGNKDRFERGYIEWDVASIPDGIDIDDVSLIYQGEENNNITSKLVSMTSTRPSLATKQVIFEEVETSPQEYLTPFEPIPFTQDEVSLGGSAVGHIQTQLDKDWFAVGISYDGTDLSKDQIFSENKNNVQAPTLKVTYDLNADGKNCYNPGGGSGGGSGSGSDGGATGSDGGTGSTGSSTGGGSNAEITNAVLVDTPNGSNINVNLLDGVEYDLGTGQFPNGGNIYLDLNDPQGLVQSADFVITILDPESTTTYDIHYTDNSQSQLTMCDHDNNSSYGDCSNQYVLLDERYYDITISIYDDQWGGGNVLDTYRAVVDMRANANEVEGTGVGPSTNQIDGVRLVDSPDGATIDVSLEDGVTYPVGTGQFPNGANLVLDVPALSSEIESAAFDIQILDEGSSGTYNQFYVDNFAHFTMCDQQNNDDYGDCSNQFVLLDGSLYDVTITIHSENYGAGETYDTFNAIVDLRSTANTNNSTINSVRVVEAGGGSYEDVVTAGGTTNIDLANYPNGLNLRTLIDGSGTESVWYNFTDTDNGTSGQVTGDNTDNSPHYTLCGTNNNSGFADCNPELLLLNNHTYDFTITSHPQDNHAGTAIDSFTATLNITDSSNISTDIAACGNDTDYCFGGSCFPIEYVEENGKWYAQTRVKNDPQENNGNSYQIGIASYRKYDRCIPNQTLFEYTEEVIAPFEEKLIRVEVPPCATQVDAYCGNHIVNFGYPENYTNGEGYFGSRKIVWDHSSTGDYPSSGTYCADEFEKDPPAVCPPGWTVSELR